jgi:hypothetical protein
MVGADSRANDAQADRAVLNQLQGLVELLPNFDDNRHDLRRIEQAVHQLLMLLRNDHQQHKGKAGAGRPCGAMALGMGTITRGEGKQGKSGPGGRGADGGPGGKGAQGQKGGAFTRGQGLMCQGLQAAKGQGSRNATGKSGAGSQGDGQKGNRGNGADRQGAVANGQCLGAQVGQGKQPRASTGQAFKKGTSSTSNTPMALIGKNKGGGKSAPSNHNKAQVNQGKMTQGATSLVENMRPRSTFRPDWMYAMEGNAGAKSSAQKGKNTSGNQGNQPGKIGSSKIGGQGKMTKGMAVCGKPANNQAPELMKGRKSVNPQLAPLSTGPKKAGQNQTGKADRISSPSGAAKTGAGNQKQRLNNLPAVGNQTNKKPSGQGKTATAKNTPLTMAQKHIGQNAGSVKSGKTGPLQQPLAKNQPQAKNQQGGKTAGVKGVGAKGASQTMQNQAAWPGQASKGSGLKQPAAGRNNFAKNAMVGPKQNQGKLAQGAGLNGGRGPQNQRQATAFQPSRSLLAQQKVGQKAGSGKSGRKG